MEKEIRDRRDSERHGESLEGITPRPPEKRTVLDLRASHQLRGLPRIPVLGVERRGGPARSNTGGEGSDEFVGDGDALKAWVAASAEALGGVDCLVSNVSGGNSPGEEGWRANFEHDVLGAVRLVEACMPHLEKDGRPCKHGKAYENNKDKDAHFSGPGGTGSIL